MGCLTYFWNYTIMAYKDVPYSIIDVFTNSRFCGNPVAVIRDATGLSDADMQSIATEFGFSETTFILPPGNTASTAKVRIFTPITEIPFAGHPNIGTAFAIATQDTIVDNAADRSFVFDELGGEVSVNVEYEDSLVTGARIIAPQEIEILGTCEPELLANCLGLSSNLLSVKRVKPCVASVGLPFAFVEVVNLSALSNIELSIPDFDKARALGPETVDGFAVCAFVLVKESAHEINLRMRVFCPLGIPPEDPATGSASGALAALLVPQDRNIDYCVNIEQGVEIGRPSQITVNMRARSSRPEIVGKCVLVSTGVLHL